MNALPHFVWVLRFLLSCWSKVVVCDAADLQDKGHEYFVALATLASELIFIIRLSCLCARVVTAKNLSTLQHVRKKSKY
jgi:hypothetical protein